MKGLTPQRLGQLEEIAARVRARVLISVHHAGGGPVSGPLSCTDLSPIRSKVKG